MATVLVPMAAASLAAGPQIPPELKEMVPPGARLVEETDPANTANKTYRIGGRLPSGATDVSAFLGTRQFIFEQKVDADDRNRTAVVDLLRHYDAQVKKFGGHRLNTEVDTSTWTAINARLFLYSRPAASGEFQFGLWIQEGGAVHWLMLFPQADQRAARADELAQRITNFGSAPLYIRFDSNKAELKADGLAAVKEVLSMLRSHPDWRLSIEGHTDNVGAADANQKLSDARARAVMQALLAEGVAATRLTATGRGQERPVADNTSESGRAKNRRVELVKIG